jgi:hypothetical protein
MRIQFSVARIMGLVALAALVLAGAGRIKPLDILGICLGILIALRIIQMSSARPRPGGAP